MAEINICMKLWKSPLLTFVPVLLTESSTLNAFCWWASSNGWTSLFAMNLLSHLSTGGLICHWHKLVVMLCVCVRIQKVNVEPLAACDFQLHLHHSTIMSDFQRGRETTHWTDVGSRLGCLWKSPRDCRFCWWFLKTPVWLQLHCAALSDRKIRKVDGLIRY